MVPISRAHTPTPPPIPTYPPAVPPQRADFGPFRVRFGPFRVRLLVTGNYRCTEVRVYPAECGEQLGTDPSKIGSSKSLVFKEFSWGENTLGLVPATLPHTLGYACTFYAPASPPPKV